MHNLIIYHYNCFIINFSIVYAERLMINNSIELNSYTSRMVKDDFKKADKYVLKLLFAHWFLATFIISIEFNTYMFGFIIGGLIFVAVYLTYIFSNNKFLLIDQKYSYVMWALKYSWITQFYPEGLLFQHVRKQFPQ